MSWSAAMRRDVTLANRSYYTKITLPAASTLLRTLIKTGLIAYNSLSDAAAEEILSSCTGFKILPKVIAGTDRAAFTVGNSATLPVEHISAGAAYEPPTMSDMNFLFVDGGAGDVLDVCVQLYLK